MTIGAEKFHLSAGDSVYFDSLQKHAYRSLVKRRCTAVVITTASST
jgi:mannose-6-phosphate isomerase-like protein (cupin superfamily)